MFPDLEMVGVSLTANVMAPGESTLNQLLDGGVFPLLEASAEISPKPGVGFGVWAGVGPAVEAEVNSPTLGEAVDWFEDAWDEFLDWFFGSDTGQVAPAEDTGPLGTLGLNGYRYSIPRLPPWWTRP